jgi:hypothetical protein
MLSCIASAMVRIGSDGCPDSVHASLPSAPFTRHAMFVAHRVRRIICTLPTHRIGSDPYSTVIVTVDGESFHFRTNIARS